MMQHASPAPALTMMATQNVPPPPYQDSPQMTATAQAPSKTQAVHISAPSAAASTPVPSATIDPQAQLEADKRAVYRHPLFPLLTLLFEKCEQATQGSECITSASFDVDIENFVHQQEQEHKAFFSDDPELDNLMVKAIQVLRIHLLELEKVNELCKDFCNRYITCLKTKMHSDNLLRNDLGGPYSPNQPSINLHSQDLLQNSPNSMSGVSNNPQGIVVPASALQQGNIAMTTVNSQVVSGGALYQPVTMVTSQGQVVTQAIPQGAIQIQNTQVNLDLTSLLDNEDKKSKNKRGVLPKHATNIMRSWLFQHLMEKNPRRLSALPVRVDETGTAERRGRALPDPASGSRHMAPDVWLSEGARQGCCGARAQGWSGRRGKRAVADASAVLVMAGKWGRKTGSTSYFADSARPLTLATRHSPCDGPQRLAGLTLRCPGSEMEDRLGV
uniref:PBX/knotted 1 homeobox 2 n=1 Tax=Suricata suricatta TaxID=37032 RepID=A0A673UD06_SURSU